MQCGPRAAGWRGRRNFGEHRRRGRPEAGAGWPGGRLCSIPSLERGGKRTGNDPRGHTRAAAAVACRPARGGAGWGDRWRLEPLWILEGVSEESVDRGGGHGGPRWTDSCTRRALAFIGGSQWCVCGGGSHRGMATT
jgi:hypothetical protein